MQPLRSYPTTQLRRNRQHDWLRDLVAETSLSPKDLVLPLFIREPSGEKMITTMPGVERHTLEDLPSIVEKALNLGIPAIALFPYTPNALKTIDGAEALNPDNLVCRALRLLKGRFGQDIGIITDVALDPYTTHGHDGVIVNDRICNTSSNTILAKQSLNQADAGADIIAPSDMMDGRVKEIRTALDQNGYDNTLIMSYAAKYATHFYGPFREAVGAGAIRELSHKNLQHKKTYQMDFRNTEEALHETAMDISEGADMVMVKPALLNLDIIYRIKQAFKVPTFAYHISGEYAYLKIAAQHGALDYEKSLLEVLYCLKRAGTDGIFTYAALDAAFLIK
ncbi:MAG: porphobilinogen synthase [Alphaproteobacteria bacterium]|nr:porphobilinogen synthase [Alphaproteobacteria bacterium]